jgi:hypothetical protein
MNLADSFYIALCMTVLLLGVVYWFWTQTQYLQRKMNLLENIVYELKTLIDRGPSASPAVASVFSDKPAVGLEQAAAEPPSYPPPPGSEFGEDDDLLHEQLHATTQKPGPSESPAPTGASDDLQPGGVGSGMPPVEPDAPFLEKPKGNVLDGMTLKELRRLAEQRSVAGASTMRKQALIDALRSDVSRAEPLAELPSSEGSPVAEGPSVKNPITMSDETTLTLQ